MFSDIVLDLQQQLKRDLALIRFLLKKNPAMGYTKIVEIGKKVGTKYSINLVVNFPKAGRIDEYDMYGKRDLSLIIDQKKKRFPINRNIIKKKAKEILEDVQIEDAYMYEGKEGVRVFTKDWKIDILPHSVHIWTEFDEKVTKFCDWLLENVYEMKSKEK